MAKAVPDFVENEGEGRLQLNGSIPDITAETEKYIALQQM
jgi:amyloid beta precursor protein binding protein 1